MSKTLHTDYSYGVVDEISIEETNDNSYVDVLQYLETEEGMTAIYDLIKRK